MMNNTQDDRLKKSADPARQSRAMQDRPVVENRTLSDEERVDMFRQQFIQAALPDLPNIPGYHVCWLTTTNPRDSIHMRMRLGYTPVKPEDVPGWEYASIKTGEYAGMIGVNEMLAFKLPQSLYQKYMVEMHHNAPLAEAEKLVQTADAIREQARAAGSDVMEGDGIAELRKAPRAPVFTE